MSTEPNLYHLRYFLDAAQLGGLAPAAKKNRVSQSAVSQGIRKLEEALNCTLLVHSRNQFQLTPQGQEALKSISEILASVGALRAQLTPDKKNLSRSLRISTLRSIALVLFPPVIAQLQKADRNLKPILKIGHTKHIVEQIIEGEIDVAVVVDNRAISGVKKRVLHEGRFNCVIGKSHRDKIKNLGFFVTEEKPGHAELKKLYLKKFKKEAPIEMLVESWEVIARFASEGLGVGLIPDFVASSLGHLDLVNVYGDLASQLKYKIVLVSKSSLSEDSIALATELEKEIKRLFT